MRSVILIGIGIIVLLISMLADSIGIGGYQGFGWKQAIGLTLGIGIVITGLVIKKKIMK